MKIKEVTIIGTGKVGGALARRLKNKGVAVHAVPHASYNEWLESDTPLGQIVIFAVKDAQLKNIIVDVETHHANELEGVVVMHVNGSLGRDVLHLLETDGAIAAAAHPFQTFSDDDPSALDLIGWGIDSTDDGWKIVKALVETTGGIPVRLKDTSDAGKRRYHAAAVAASNFAYAAYDLGRQLADNAGLDPLRFLVPIMQRTFENAADALHDDEPFGVTGPLVRGDLAAVEQQLRALPEDLRPMYRHLSLALLEVKSLSLSNEQKAEMKDLLSRQIDD